jgi:hypothetical protein
MQGIYPDTTLERYLTLIKRMENYFKGFQVKYIERSKNTDDDELVKAVAWSTLLLADVFFHLIEDVEMKTVEPEPRLMKCHRKGKLASTHNGIRSPLSWAR